MNKPRYTIIVKDNTKNENLLEFDVPALNYSLNTTPVALGALNKSGVIREFVGNETALLKLEANVLLSQSELERKPKAYDLDEEVTEEITDCRYGHDWSSVVDFQESKDYCKKCGIKRDEM
ncbi:MAG TPA: hypothetical protein VN855_00270 [Candidatus Acidoferrum sp.]|nr:hypothetical protein [Candidatus Acidoferrum sp.]